MTLQLSHIFLTEARTFMFASPRRLSSSFLFVAVSDSTAIQVIRRKLYKHAVTGKNTYEVLAHLARDVREHLVLVIL
jgi:hypothetical protein